MSQVPMEKINVTGRYYSNSPNDISPKWRFS
jgi:hypothetical protein